LKLCTAHNTSSTKWQLFQEEEAALVIFRGHDALQVVGWVQVAVVAQDVSITLHVILDQVYLARMLMQS